MPEEGRGAPKRALDSFDTICYDTYRWRSIAVAPGGARAGRSTGLAAEHLHPVAWSAKWHLTPIVHYVTLCIKGEDEWIANECWRSPSSWPSSGRGVSGSSGSCGASWSTWAEPSERQPVNESDLRAEVSPPADVLQPQRPRQRMSSVPGGRLRGWSIGVPPHGPPLPEAAAVCVRGVG